MCYLGVHRYVAPVVLTVEACLVLSIVFLCHADLQRVCVYVSYT